MKACLGVAILAMGLMVGVPEASSAQTPSESAASRGHAWPRWEGAPTSAPSGGAVQDAAPSSGGGVFGLSVLGAGLGWSAGLLTGVAICSQGCGDGEYDALVPVLLAAVAGGGLGSALLGCTAAHEPGCTARVLPKAFLGTLAAVGASVAVASATDDWLGAWITFSAIQGLVTARAIR